MHIDKGEGGGGGILMVMEWTKPGIKEIWILQQHIYVKRCGFHLHDVFIKCGLGGTIQLSIN